MYQVQPMNAQSQEAAEEKLLGQRKAVHQQLLLPLDRPLLRRANALDFDAEDGGGGGGPQLRNVHEGLGPSGVSGGKAHLIWGTYSYFHYMQVCSKCLCQGVAW